MSSQGLTEHSLRSSTTTVSESYRTGQDGIRQTHWMKSQNAHITDATARLWDRCDKDMAIDGKSEDGVAENYVSHIILI